NKGGKEMEMNNIAVFCGSSTGANRVYMEYAEKFGKALANNNQRLVYGGAEVGCMGALADATLQNGGKVTGVIPQILIEVEIAYDQLTVLYVVETMHERKSKVDY